MFSREAKRSVLPRSGSGEAARAVVSGVTTAGRGVPRVARYAAEQVDPSSVDLRGVGLRTGGCEGGIGR